MRRFALRGYQRAQAGEAICRDQSAENQFAERLFNHRRQQTRSRNDVDEKRRAMFFQIIETVCGFVLSGAPFSGGSGKAFFHAARSAGLVKPPVCCAPAKSW
jgi:hypothetical protein